MFLLMQLSIYRPMYLYCGLRDYLTAVIISVQRVYRKTFAQCPVYKEVGLQPSWILKYEGGRIDSKELFTAGSIQI